MIRELNLELEGDYYTLDWRTLGEKGPLLQLAVQNAVQRQSLTELHLILIEGFPFELFTNKGEELAVIEHTRCWISMNIIKGSDQSSTSQTRGVPRITSYEMADGLGRMHQVGHGTQYGDYSASPTVTPLDFRFLRRLGVHWSEEEEVRVAEIKKIMDYTHSLECLDVTVRVPCTFSGLSALIRASCIETLKVLSLTIAVDSEYNPCPSLCEELASLAGRNVLKRLDVILTFWFYHDAIQDGDMKRLDGIISSEYPHLRTFRLVIDIPRKSVRERIKDANLPERCERQFIRTKKVPGLDFSVSMTSSIEFDLE